MAKVGSIVMKQAEIIQAGILLQQHLVKQEGGLYRYVDDWSDDKIAETVGRINGSHIERLRRQLGMALERHVKPHSASAYQARLDLLIEQHNKLCDALEADTGTFLAYTFFKLDV